MAHFMAPLRTAHLTQHKTITPKTVPKAPAPRSSCRILLLEGKCDTRRAFLHGMIAAGAGSFLATDTASAAAKRRPSAPVPTEEKMDPNISGIQAKVLASKKRKEAMKEAMAKLREKGKAIGQ